MNRTSLSFCLILCLGSLFAQAQFVPCGHHLAIESMEEKYPGYKAAVQQTFEEAKRVGKESRLYRSADTYTVPVVVHVVWNEEEENIPDSLITSQIEVLNEDYRRLNADAINIRPDFEDVVGDPMIEFDLVAIERVSTTELFEVDLTGTLPDNVKVTTQGGSDAYDTETHLNIWVCKIQPINIGGFELGQVLGFAYPPAGLSNWPEGVEAPSTELEGVVIDYRVMGRNNDFEVDLGLGSPLVTKGRTATHEVGHYLGLRHVWGDGGGIFGGDSCGEDDGVEDTPNTGGQANFDCDDTRNTCMDAIDDRPDMIENFMDYASEDCMNSFTQGQIDLMRGVLETSRCALVGACEDTATKNIDLSTQFKIAPNPSSGRLSFETSVYNIQDFDVRMMNLAGQDVPFTINFNSQEVQINHAENGLYILKLQRENVQIIKKISIVK